MQKEPIFGAYLRERQDANGFASRARIRTQPGRRFQLARRIVKADLLVRIRRVARDGEQTRVPAPVNIGVKTAETSAIRVS